MGKRSHDMVRDDNLKQHQFINVSNTEIKLVVLECSM